MNAKLTLRMDDTLILQAKEEAARRGKSVSQMVSEFVHVLGATQARPENIPPITASLLGILNGKTVSENDYKEHLKEKYL